MRLCKLSIRFFFFFFLALSLCKHLESLFIYSSELSQTFNQTRTFELTGFSGPQTLQKPRTKFSLRSCFVAGASFARPLFQICLRSRLALSQLPLGRRGGIPLTHLLLALSPEIDPRGLPVSAISRSLSHFNCVAEVQPPQRGGGVWNLSRVAETGEGEGFRGRSQLLCCSVA